MAEVAEIQGEVVTPAAKPRRRNGDGRAVVKAEASPVPATTTPGAPSLLAILQAVMTDPTASIERMNSAFDFYQRLEAAQARKAFETAMAAAKAEFDPIVKRHEVKYSTTSYKHEDLADIEAAVKPALSKHGLSYRWRVTSKPNEPVSVTCVVTHEGGHFEETTLHAGADNSGGKNSIQGVGSTLTYLQRYTLKPALGLAAARDDDGKRSDDKPAERITEQQAKELEALAAKARIDPQIIREHFKVEAFGELTPAQLTVAKGRIEKKLKLEAGE
jgi:hypothetical protein